MTVTVTKPASKNADKIPVASKKASPKPVSPRSVEDEVIALRTRNKVLSDALKAVNDVATDHLKKNFDLVWFARNRNRYPNHEASKRIENSDEHKEELSKLRSPDGDYHHGFHSGVLAAARMFREQSKIVHINEHDELDEEFWNEVEEHSKKMEESKEKFPHLDVNQFPAPELVESKDE